MQGKIIVYSAETGLGKIITQEKKKFNFSVDDWDEYETMPAIGQIVSFIPESIRAQNITLLDPPKNEQPAAPPTEIPSTSTPVAEPESQVVDLSSVSTPGAAAAEPENGSINAIELSMEVDECIKTYFANIILATHGHDTIKPGSHELDFLRMKRFLLTAYNNLIEIDQGLENKELSVRKNNLLEIHKVYLEFESKVSYVKRAYEIVFLKRQAGYKRLHERIERNKNEIGRLGGIAQSQDELIKSKSKQLSQLAPKSEAATTIRDELKILKRTMVDAIHQMGTLTESNRIAVELLDNFYKMHYDRFTQEFSRFVEATRSKLLTIQNHLAYKFDTLLWLQANKSKAIGRFFQEASITDEFSAVTYLRYYIKSLDTSKLNEQNQELLGLLGYLEEQAQRKIYCVDEDIDFLMQFKSVLVKTDKDLRIRLCSRESSITKDLRQFNAYTLIINPQMRRMHAGDIIKTARAINPNIEIICFVSTLSKETLTVAKKNECNALYLKSYSETKMAEQIKQLLEMGE